MAYKDDLKKEIDLVSLISQYTDLKPLSDHHWIGRCPHPDHEDKNPSFHVFPNQNGDLVWFCFGCCTPNSGWHDPYYFGYDCYGFFRWMSNTTESKRSISFLEAISMTRDFKMSGKSKAAFKYEQPIKQAVNDESLYQQEKLRATAAHNNLTEEAKSYLHDRGLDDQDLKEWLIGYRQVMHQYRISFPLFDRDQRIIGHISRTMTDQQPKYINSRTSSIFKKSDYLYGIHRVNGTDQITVVEGVFDVILGYKYGMNNLVGSLNSNPNPELLKPYRRITFMLDNDKAGIEGTRRSIANIDHDHELMICKLPEKDLGAFAPLIKEGLTTWIENHTVPIKESP